MEHLDSSQQSQNFSGLDERKTVLEQGSDGDVKKPVAPSKRHVLPKVILGVLLGAW